jgi:hypothetical protein
MPSELCLLGMKCGLLGLHPLNQFLDPGKHSLIANSGRHALVMLDLVVEFDALLTHGTRRCRATRLIVRLELAPFNTSSA